MLRAAAKLKICRRDIGGPDTKKRYKMKRKTTHLILCAIAAMAFAGCGQSRNVAADMTEVRGCTVFSIGGAYIYLPEANGFFAKHKAKKSLKYRREGDTNVIVYNGMTVKYPDQTLVRYDGQSTLPAKIYTHEGWTELVLNGAVVIGSKNSDKIVSRCTNSLFYLEGDSTDIDIVRYTKKIPLEDDRPQRLGCTFEIGEGDQVISIILYTYYGELAISMRDHMVKVNGEIQIVNSETDYFDMENDTPTVRLKNRAISLDEDDGDDE